MHAVPEGLHYQRSRRRQVVRSSQQAVGAQADRARLLYLRLPPHLIWRGQLLTYLSSLSSDLNCCIPPRSFWRSTRAVALPGSLPSARVPWGAIKQHQQQGDCSLHAFRSSFHAVQAWDHAESSAPPPPTTRCLAHAMVRQITPTFPHGLLGLDSLDHTHTVGDPSRFLSFCKLAHAT